VAVGLESVSVVPVAPEMFEYDEPPLLLTCHCTVGVGLPVAAAVKVTGWPAVTVWLAGVVLTVGAYLTVSVALVVIAEPTLFVKTAR
jgi:hypothetical protein